MGMGKREKKSSSNSLSTSPCANLRTAYHNCFNRWYSEKFVKGQWDKEECVAEWKKYRACLSEHLDDKHLSRFLEAEGSVDSVPLSDLRNPVDGAPTGVSQ
ncbi:Mitochondrial distribution/morphology family 35/apoptosis protein [Melia azedarach]|uniref:Mitochondrial distribution/morphology family 35/apoptosis protein n=1 Tax=Melia azedarach TaxID=155640 RepID=A0ACC1XCJ9_MELAZ|nr:Mitochondrial distribution/morphology family 35/apoptosis protein [Melia azedarach]